MRSSCTCLVKIPTDCSLDRSLLWLLMIALLVVPSLSISLCPHDSVYSANACMEPYSARFHDMINNAEQLFTGIDIESLRLFCTGFKKSMRCIEQLRVQCKEDANDAIKSVLVNLEGSEEALRDLCKDDNIYELYARFMGCYMDQSHVSRACFKQHMNISIQLLASYSGSARYLCRDLTRVIGCIKGNIVDKCGNEAASLTERLVRPMVRRSSLCYVRDMKETQSTHQRRKHHQRKNAYKKLQSTSLKPKNSATLTSSLTTLSKIIFQYIILKSWVR